MAVQLYVDLAAVRTGNLGLVVPFFEYLSSSPTSVSVTCNQSPVVWPMTLKLLSSITSMASPFLRTSTS